MRLGKKKKKTKSERGKKLGFEITQSKGQRSLTLLEKVGLERDG
jgi:hypothetical protein